MHAADLEALERKRGMQRSSIRSNGPHSSSPSVLVLRRRDTSQYASGQWNVKSADLDFPVPVPQQHQTPL